jgi:hypothetical protein
MKKNKWRKWQVGAAASLAAAFLFQQVKSSEAFTQAVEKAHPTAAPNQGSTAGQDPVIQDWYTQNGGNDGNDGSLTNNNGNGGDFFPSDQQGQSHAFGRSRTSRS